MQLSEYVGTVADVFTEPMAGGPMIATDPVAVTAALCAHLETLPGLAGVRAAEPLCARQQRRPRCTI